MSVTPPILSVDKLQTHFTTEAGVVKAVDGLSFDICPGEMVGLVGESGCGKSATAMSILRLLPSPPARIVEGSITFEGRNLLELGREEIQKIRGRDISMIFQEPMTSLNPVMTVGRQIREVLELHQKMSREEIKTRVIEALSLVRIPNPEQRMNEYPHQMSGGMRQRVMIAMALACRPKVLIADEPTTALDVTIQAQILKLVADLRSRTGTAVLIITHDLGVVAETVDRVIVMYAGRKVEEASVGDLFARPSHPYTIGLMGSVPVLGGRTSADRRARLAEIPGTVPSLAKKIEGCAFAPRCPKATERCRTQTPPLVTLGEGHRAACWEVAPANGGHA